MNTIRYFFTGRIGRLAFLFGALYYLLVLMIPYFIIAIVYLMILHAVLPKAGKGAIEGPVVALAVIVYVLLILASLSLSARRLNDTDHPSWFCILAIIPFVNIPLTLYLLLAPGTKGDNAYGSALEGYGFWQVTKLSKKRLSS